MQFIQTIADVYVYISHGKACNVDTDTWHQKNIRLHGFSKFWQQGAAEWRVQACNVKLGDTSRYLRIMNVRIPLHCEVIYIY